MTAELVGGNALVFSVLPKIKNDQNEKNTVLGNKNKTEICSQQIRAISSLKKKFTQH